jgi:lipopolysaccharide/colanic/teichoic acid biosynthesis glycosyltransferase
LFISLPVLLFAFAGIALSDGRPLLFRQIRIGKGSKPFELIKLRTMRSNSQTVALTTAGDARIFPFGRFLRRWKLDELPQLWNVIRGDMSLVGPRPEAPRYVDLSDPVWAEVLSVRPGITSEVTLALRDEEGLLASSGPDPEEFYRTRLLPWKLRLEAEHTRTRSATKDISVLMRTAGAIFGLQTPATSGHSLYSGEIGAIFLGENHDQS